MQVPLELMENNKEWIKNQIFVTRYIENAPTKIYTEVRENLLVIVLKGKKNLIYKDFEVTISEGEFALFKKGNYIMSQILSNDIYESILIFLSDDLLMTVPKTVKETKNEMKTFFKGYTISYMEQEANTILRLMQDKEDYSEMIKLKVLELLMYIQKMDKKRELAALLNTFSNKKTFKEEVISNYDLYNNLNDMAVAMSMSLSTFKRKFNKEFNCTPHKWIRDRKLMKATMLLRTTDYSVTDICYICGFESLSTFMLDFKKNYGISPGKYRIRDK